MRGEHVGARGADHLAGGQRGRDDRRAGMQRCRRHGCRRSRASGPARRSGRPRRPACSARHRRTRRSCRAAMPMRADGGQERGGAFGVVPRADDVADQVEHQEAGARHDLGRQPVEPDAGGERGKLAVTPMAGLPASGHCGSIRRHGQAAGRCLRVFDRRGDTGAQTDEWRNPCLSMTPDCWPGCAAPTRWRRSAAAREYPRRNSAPPATHFFDAARR